MNFQLVSSPILSLSRGDSRNSLWWVICLAALIGALYGTFVQVVWASEAVEFGQALAGLVDYKRSSWGQTMFADPSLQITIPALLLLAGVSPWILSIIATAFFCALSFSAVAAASYVFTRNKFVSLAIPLLLLSYNFVNSHGYTVLYPVSSSQFGQTGQYFSLLGLSILACEWPIAAGIIGGLLSGVHAVWCLCFVVGAFPVTYWLQNSLFKRLFISFFITLSVSLSFLYLSNSAMPSKPAYQAPTIPQSFIVSSTKTKPASPNEHFQETPSKKRIRAVTHNVLLGDAPTPMWAAGIFFLPTLIFILLSFSFYFLSQTSQSFNNKKFAEIKQFLLMSAIPISLIIVFKTVEEIDPNFYYAGLIDKRLPSLILRAIFNRWLNLTTLLIPIMTISLLFALVRDKKSWPATIGLSIFLVFAIVKRGWFIIPAQGSDNILLLPNAFFIPLAVTDINLIIKILVVLVLFVCLMIHAKNNLSKRSFINDKPILIVMTLFIAFSMAQIAHLAHKAYINSYVSHKFAKADKYEQLALAAQKDKGPIIISSGVLGDFSPPLRTARAMIVPSDLDVYDSLYNKLIHVYCRSDALMPVPIFYQNIEPCFEGRAAHEWSVIARETTATGLITPDTWHLKIKPIVSSGGLSYYRLTDNFSS